MEPTLLTPITAEFANVDLGDDRLTKRLQQIAESAERAPGSSLPEQAGSSAALEATYRFFGNDNVSPEAVFEGHVNATVERASAAQKVFVIHDTTEFRFGGDKKREGLGWISTKRRNGFLAHYSFCVSSDGKPLGSLGLFAWHRKGKPKGRMTATRRLDNPDRESLRWQDAALLTGELLHDKTQAIHLMDREGDAYELLALLLEHEQRFVIRAGFDRRLEAGRGTPASAKLYESLEGAPFLFEREVTLSARRNSATKRPTNVAVFPARKRRLARLEVRAGHREIFVSHTAPVHFPPSLSLNFVEVREVDPPDGEEGVLWRLATTEPIETCEQVAAIIDAYRQRWLVEEFFKAVKTGCRYQDLQLETGRALLVALAIESAVAWRLLLMRWVANQDPTDAAECVLPAEQLQLLVALSKAETKRALPSQPNVRDAMLEVARLGGHIKNNGPPGWLILRRGFDKLLTIHRGWSLAQESQ